MADEQIPSPQIGALLRIAWEHLQRELYDNLREAGFELRETHRQMIRYPGVDGLRPTELAEQLNLSKQAVNDLLRDFESTGLIRLERDPADGRARIIRYTDRGWRMYHLASQTSRNIGERWAAQLGNETVDAVVSGLKSIRALYPNPTGSPRRSPS